MEKCQIEAKKRYPRAGKTREAFLTGCKYILSKGENWREAEPLHVKSRYIQNALFAGEDFAKELTNNKS